MKFLRRDERGAVSSAAAITLLSVVIGGGAATAAVFGVISANGPKDSTAIVDGKKDIVPPEDLLNYGG
ncbi:hypothetical protein ASD62_00515 [Phycicoccus sp. Root563]|uniref:hypothetical protein n=1 Tax=Phycicoccus sp. Root563 TaxID=1736562 RepID=UPI0007024A77|nr:hypothetical protein [Phycicoccus sp. Root563]KQZ88028.1 hypothetical protein ASD62_00515 [Phycicoccus sp. Root563]